MDRGGNLAHRAAIVDLFQHADYSVQTTAADSSHQNGPVERPHRTIGDALCAMLSGSGLDYKFWPYAFHHFLRLYNFTVHGTRSQSPYEIFSGGCLPSLHRLRTFGCRVYTIPRKTRPAKLNNDARKGIFLGYSQTLRNILYYDSHSHHVRCTRNVIFDEGFNDLPVSKRHPHARLLAAATLANIPSPSVSLPESAPPLNIITSPFSLLQTVYIPIRCTDPTLGLRFDHCSHQLRAYISSVVPSSSAALVRRFGRRFIGAYVVSLNNLPVFSVPDLLEAFTTLSSASDAPGSYSFLLAPERKSDFDGRKSPLHLQVAHLRRICALRSTPGEAIGARAYVESLCTHDCAVGSNNGLLSIMGRHSLHRNSPLRHPADHDTLFGCDDPPPSVPPVQTVHRIHGTGATLAELALPSFTRKRLQSLPNWSVWSDAFDLQLDAHHKQGTFGNPCRPPSGATILRPHWANIIKADGTRKCRLCADGSKRAAPALHHFAETYASCIEQPCMRMFFAIAAARGLIIHTGDCTNAYANADSPTHPTFLGIDKAYSTWYFRRHKKNIHHGFVLPVQKSLQGHPEAGALWEKHIVGILHNGLGFRSTVQERNLYQGHYLNEEIFICRQTDDFAIAAFSARAATSLIHAIGAKVDIWDDGLLTKFNGIDVDQTRNFVKLSCSSYLHRVLKAHSWEQPNHHETDCHNIIPISDEFVKRISLAADGPAEHSPSHRILEMDVGFSYRQVLGQLIYTYVVGRLDFGYAITFLARFSQCPTREHYDALRHVCKYLRQYIDWGIVYWRTTPRSDLPRISIDPIPTDPTLPSFPLVTNLLELVGFFDVSHANDLKTRRSVTGLVFCLAGGAIAFKSKLQPTVSTSSTEAEFISSVHTAMLAKYLRSILLELGFPQVGPTVLYGDNLSSIAMVNSNRPTNCSCHIDIQYFAIQQWRENLEIILRHIPGVINPSDAGTKALGWILHHRHVRRSMGHFGDPQSAPNAQS
jgi:hypothetical protein